MIRLLTAVLLFASFHAVAEVTLTPLNNNTPADADEVMGNFNALKQGVEANATAIDALPAPPTDCTADQIIKWDGSDWVCATDPLANLSGCSVGDVLSYDGNAIACGHVVSPSAGEGGSISPDTKVFVAARDTTTFTVSPDSGWEVASIDGTCGGSLSGNTYTTNPIIAACTVEASFFDAPTYYTVNPTVISGGGFTDPSHPFQVLSFDQAIIDVYADPGCTVSYNYTGDCLGDLEIYSEGELGTFFIQSVSYDCTFEARFECDLP